MENNNVTSKQKTKKLIILLAAFFLLCGAGLGGAFAWKNWKEQAAVESVEKEEVTEETVVNGELVLDEEGMPEDGSDITETKKASDSETLRELLKAGGKFAIELTEDVRIEETLVVNGTKKLVGNKSIVMELYAEPFQSVASVSTGATLILDGVTLDGNGIANGVSVEKKAGFTGISGKILYPVPYGITVAGVAKINDITIEHSMDIGLCAQEGGKIQLNGGKIIDSNQTNIHIQPTAQVSINGNPVIEGSHYAIRNRGTCVVTGGTVRDVSGYFVYNSGDLTIDYKGKDANDRLEWSNALGEAGIRTGVGSTTYIQGLYIHDMKKMGISVVNHNDVEIENCVIANTGSYGFSSYNGKEEAVLTNVQILDTKASAVRTKGTTKVTLTDLTVKNTTGFGIKNENNLVVAKNVVIEGSENTGIWGNQGSETQVDGATITKPGKFGVENNSAKMSLKNVTITNPKRMGYVGKKQSVTEITKMTIENAPERGIYNLGGKVTASDVTVLSSGTYGVSTAKSQGHVGSLIITNLTVTGVAEKDAANCYESVLEITNGKLSGAKRYGAIASKGGKLKLTDVEISDCGERGVIGSGGEITLKNVKVTNPGKFGVTIGKTKEHKGSLTAENLTITGVKGNALNNNGSIMTVTNGKISDVTGNGAYAENGAQLTLANVEMKDCQKRGVYANDAGTKVALTDIKIINAGQSSIFQEAGTVVEAERVDIQSSGSYGVFVKSATLNAKQLSVVGTGSNGLHVSSSAEEGQSLVTVDGLTVTKAGERGVYNLGGKVTLANVTITNPGAMGATSSKTGNYTGELNITNLTLTGVTGEKENNALNCNGSVLKVTKGNISDVAGNGAYVENAGQLTLASVEIKDCDKRGVYVNDAGTKAIITGTKLVNTGESSIFQEAGTIVEADGMNIESPGSYGVFVKSATLQAKNVTVTGSVDNSVNISASAETGKAMVNVEGLTVTNAGDRAICNTGGEATLTNVTITNPATFGATTTNAGEYVGKLDITNLTMTGVLANNALNCNGSVLNVTTGTISNVKQNGAYVENGGQATLKGVEIAGCERRGIYVNGAASKATVENVKVSDTIMTNIRVKDGELNATDVVVAMNDQIGQSVGEEDFYGICMVGAESKVTISGEKSTVTRTAAADVTPEKSAIWVNAGTLTINDGVYSGLRAEKGGVLFNNGGSVVINNGIFENNKASVHGGVMFVEKGSTVINNGVFRNNGAADRGGVVLSKKNITINGGEFAGNTASGTIGGGAIGCTGGTTLTVTGGYFHGNKATSTADKADVYGGGAIESAGNVVISGGTFEANEAQKGGAVYIDKAGGLTISGGTFGGQEEGKGNVATYSGGVLYIVDAATKTASINGATFIGNKVTNASGSTGGVMYVGSGANVTIGNIEGCEFTNNKAEYTGTSTKQYSYGGVMYIKGGTVNVANTTFSGNQAKLGGVAYVTEDSGSLTLENCECSTNEGTTNAKDIYCNKGVTNVAGKVIAEVVLNNSAKIHVSKALAEESAIVIKIANTSSIKNKTRVVVTFANDTMESSKGYFALHSAHSSKTLEFADNKATIK